MKKTRKVSNRRPAAKRGRAFRAGLFACALLFAGVAAAAATYASRNSAQPAPKSASFVNAQQGPLAPADAQQIVGQLEGNKATEGLVREQHPDGTVEVDLQGRFQNVTLARRNDDGSVSASCVDTPESAGAFLSGAGDREVVTVGGSDGGTNTVRPAEAKR